MVWSQKIILETNVAFRPEWKQCSIPLLNCSIQNTFIVQYFHRQNWKKSVGCMNFYQRQLLLLWKREDIFVNLYLFMILFVILPSKTTCRRSDRSSGEENNDKDDADCGQDDVGHVETDSHNSSLSSLCQGHLQLKK